MKSLHGSLLFLYFQKYGNNGLLSSRLFGDATAGPVTAIAGSPGQMFGGVVPGYVR